MERIELFNDHSEKWLPIPGYDGYEASSTGLIRSVDRQVAQKGHKNAYTRIMKGKIIKPGVLNSGYQIAWLSVAGKTFAVTVHRLVALTFLPNPNDYQEINHINGNKKDNRVENIEWVSRSMNIRHAYTLPRKSMKKPVYCVNLNCWFASPKDAAQQLGLNAKGITNAANGHSKSSGGYVWRR